MDGCRERAEDAAGQVRLALGDGAERVRVEVVVVVVVVVELPSLWFRPRRGTRHMYDWLTYPPSRINKGVPKHATLNDKGM